MTTEEMRSKWSRIVDSMPFGVDVEFDVSDKEAQVIMELLDERGDTLFSVETINQAKSSYVN